MVRGEMSIHSYPILELHVGSHWSLFNHVVFVLLSCFHRRSGFGLSFSTLQSFKLYILFFYTISQKFVKFAFPSGFPLFEFDIH